MEFCPGRKGDLDLFLYLVTSYTGRLDGIKVKMARWIEHILTDLFMVPRDFFTRPASLYSKGTRVDVQSFFDSFKHCIKTVLYSVITFAQQKIVILRVLRCRLLRQQLRSSRK